MLTNKKGGGPRKYSDLEMRKIKNQDSTQPSFDKQVNEYRAIHNRNVEKLAVPNGNNTNQPNHYDIGFKPTLVYHPDNICLNPMEDQNQGRNIPMANGNAYDAYNMHGFLTPENHDPKANFKNNGTNQNTNFQVNVQQYGTANDNFKGNSNNINFSNFSTKDN
ncbi:hypothetical protein AX774_g6492 [Zancudomyces culisetae]|uniref:Uncharacterized protein n=1 Tax=Zancudomyces culisetae TaxID=1213189 RepID=A0A1R1PGH1_ZANCU|nr:hypothetical protein AX774_g6492 [Zancudomyces culisetae]|eukprot:OMH80076.1 hypothetical protein AX774_g6492 [Zancudomyces culisetae]